jgi:hypothetical protein
MRTLMAAVGIAAAMVLTLGLASAAPKKAVRLAVVPEAPQELMIPLGRVQIFGEQQQQAMADLKESVDDDSRNPNSLYGKLFVAVWIHNVNVQRACEEKIISRKLCRTSRFRPWWLKDPGTVVYSYKSLIRFVEEAQTAMTPFWSDLCARASKEKKENLNEYCPME